MAGLLDSILCTSHASTLKDQRKEFPKANWQRKKKYTEQGLIYITAGVSAAVEGSLHLVKVLLGEAEMEKIMNDIQYPSAHLRLMHQSNEVGLSTQFNILFKTWFKSNKRVGGDSNVNELQLAAILDAYNRTFPAVIETFTTESKIVISEHGLQLLPLSAGMNGYDEIHVPRNNGSGLKGSYTEIIDYSRSGSYIFPEILARIEKQYSPQFRITVERLLDYN